MGGILDFYMTNNNPVCLYLHEKVACHPVPLLRALAMCLNLISGMLVNDKCRSLKPTSAIGLTPLCLFIGHEIDMPQLTLVKGGGYSCETDLSLT